MNWEQFQLWHNYLLNTEYKDNLISTAISEFSRVITDHKNGFSNFDQNKEDLTKKEWDLYGKINSILNKIKIKFKVNLDLPRQRCETSQIFKRKTDIQKGMMYNMPAELNGIDTNDNNYFYIPLHKTRRHIHGIPIDFIEQYIINMIDTAQWEKYQCKYYYSVQCIENINDINVCAIYECPEKFCIKNLTKKIKKQVEKVEKIIKCNKKINVFSKIKEFKKYISLDVFSKVIKYFNKKLVDNFRINFPQKSRYITYCAGSCIHSEGFIHNGIPSGKQKCYDCNITFCRECNKSPYHDNELCNFTDEIIFDKPDDYRKCPGCGIWIEREEGCSHMKCKCGVHFCYDCRGILCANDPYYHVCKMDKSDPHYRDFRMNHPSVQHDGEIACDCRNCI
jgi:hypothetical protein